MDIATPRERSVAGRRAPSAHDTANRITQEFHETSYAHPVIFLSVILTLYLGTIATIGLSDSWVAKLLCGVVLSIAVGKLFVVGHDACHGSFTPSARLNRTISFIALTVAYHVPATWRYWHNVVHHAFTNDLTRDFVWRPLSRAEFAASPRWRRRLERLYRHHSSVGIGLYYLLEILLPKMLVVPPVGASKATRSARLQMVAFHLFHLSVLGWLAMGSSLFSGSWPSVADVAVNLACGFVGPLLYVCYALGFVVYFNHTHPEIKWYRGMTAGFTDHQTSATLYLKFQGISEFLLPSDIMSHVAHHLDTKIPVRHLPKAQERLVEQSGLSIRVEIWSWAFQSRVMRICKLYDPDEHQWTGFEGDVGLAIARRG